MEDKLEDDPESKEYADYKNTPIVARVEFVDRSLTE
jgi:hypothetical protein